MTQALVDPQLAAFYAANPEILQDPSIIQAEPPPDHHLTSHERAEMELAVAFLVMAYAVSRTLARQSPTTEPAAQAGQAWRHHAPLWARLAVPAIIQAYDELPIPAGDKQALAEDYAETLGDYLNESSADALAAGYAQQLGRGGPQLSWVRSVTAYGCDAPDTRGIMATLAAGTEAKVAEPITAAAKIAIQKARVVRADLMGQTEARTASEAAKAVLWLSGQRDGSISASAVAVWRTHHSEHECPICGPMDGVARELEQPFVMPDGRTLWAACAHPHCQCHAELVERSTLQKDKDGDLYDRDTKGRFADREYRTRNVTRLAYADPEATTIAQELVEQVVNPFGVDMRTAEQRNPFMTGAPVNPFLAAGNPFRPSTPVANPFLESENPFLAPEVENSVDAKARGRNRTTHHIFLSVKRQGPKPAAKHETHYLDHGDISAYYEQPGMAEAFQTPGVPVDFDNINDYFTHNSEEHGRMVIEAIPEDYIWNAMQPQVWDIDDDEWHSVIEQALPVWHQALTHVDSITSRLQSPELKEIYRRAGTRYPLGDANNSAEDKARTAIASLVLDSNSPDRSLEEAYADFITWNMPGEVGEDGESLGFRTAALLGDSDDVDFQAEPPIVYSFDQGFNGDTPELRGTYEVAHVIYHSALGSWGQDAPVGKLSVRELEMEPIESLSGRSPYTQPPPGFGYQGDDFTGDKHPWD